jgi:signal peptidase I
MQKHRHILDKHHGNKIYSQDDVKFILYKGSSMSSTLHDMDVLYYIPNKKIRPGDVVVIKISESEGKVIHRVISVGEKGIRTMGDFNPLPDSWLLKPDQIAGRVVYGYRGRKRFLVRGGLVGLVQMSQVRFKHRSIKVVCPVLSRIFHPILNIKIPLIRPQSVAFKRPEGTELQLITLGKVIGRRLPGQKWQIKFPFRFFIDDNSLPN